MLTQIMILVPCPTPGLHPSSCLLIEVNRAFAIPETQQFSLGTDAVSPLGQDDIVGKLFHACLWRHLSVWS